MAIVSVVGLFHLGLGDQIQDFPVGVELLGGDPTPFADQFIPVENSSSDHPVDSFHPLVEIVRGPCFQSAKDSKQILEVVETVLLLTAEVFDGGEAVDLHLDASLTQR